MWPSSRVLGALVLAGLLGQLGGNVVFQWSLGIIGMGLTVPLCMGMIILASAILARAYLNESVTPLAAVSMAVLITAIWILSLGAGDAYRSIANAKPQGWLIIAGVGAACLSGFAYSVLGVVIRYGVTGKASVAATTFTVGIIGVCVLGVLSYARIGLEGIAGTSAVQWSVMIAAGVFNLVAFLALAKALQLTSVVYVNAINASQVAMSVVAGVLLFGEFLSPALTAGVLLTVVGLLLMPRQRHAARDAGTLTSELRPERGHDRDSDCRCPPTTSSNLTAIANLSRVSSVANPGSAEISSGGAVVDRF